jgi:O-antigen/teichoic acid export membrane protein
MSAYRPRFSSAEINEIWAFSRWWMLMDAMRFFGHRGEALILAGVTTPQVIGVYSVGAELSVDLTQDVVGPACRALFPSYVKIVDKRGQFLRAFELSFAFLATFSLAAGVGASVIAKDLVVVLLGDQWLGAVPFVQWLAIHGAFWSIVQSSQPYFLVTKQEKLFALCNIVYVAVLIPALIGAAHIANVEVVAITRTAVTAILLTGILVVLVLQAFGVEKLVGLLWRPLIATTVMAICVSSINLAMPPILALSLRVATGLVVFPAALVVLWGASGWPDGLERVISALLANYSKVARDRLKRI